MRADRGAPGTANARPRWSIEEYYMAANVRYGSLAAVAPISREVRSRVQIGHSVNLTFGCQQALSTFAEG
jgi:hypothetical protein